MTFMQWLDSDQAITVFFLITIVAPCIALPLVALLKFMRD